MRIEHLDLAGMEIGRVDKVMIVVTANGKPFVDGMGLRAVHYQDCMGRVNGGIPPGDRAVFGRKQEKAWARFSLFFYCKVIRLRAVYAVEENVALGCCTPFTCC